MSEPTLASKVVLLSRGLQEAGLPYAFGGALALAYYAEPRATVDIDVNVFVRPDRYPEVEVLLGRIGVERFPSAASVARDGQGRSWWGRTPVDLFFSYDEVHRAMQRDARVVPFGDDEIVILSPEHLVVAKVVFNRPKDWIDIDQVLVCVPRFDVEEASRWLFHLIGRDDPRSLRFEEAVTRIVGDDRTES